MRSAWRLLATVIPVVALLLPTPDAGAQSIYFPDHLRRVDSFADHTGHFEFDGWWERHYPARPDPNGPNGINTTRTHFRLSAKGKVERFMGVGGRTLLTANYRREFTVTSPASLQLAFYADGIWDLARSSDYLHEDIRFEVSMEVNILPVDSDLPFATRVFSVQRDRTLPWSDWGGEVYRRQLQTLTVPTPGRYVAAVNFTLDAHIPDRFSPPGEPDWLYDAELSYDFESRRPWLDDPPLNSPSRGYPGGIGLSMEASPLVGPHQLTARQRVRAALARETFLGGIVPTPPSSPARVGVLEPGRPHVADFDAPSPFRDSPYPTGSGLVGGIGLSSGTLADPLLRSTRLRCEHATAVASIITGAGDPRYGAESIGINPNAVVVGRPLHNTDFTEALLDLADEVDIINMSFAFRNLLYGRAATEAANAAVLGNPNLLIVSAAGNTGNVITHPGPNNGLVVGALDSTLQKRAGFSAFRPHESSGWKPDLVAPGQYILAVQPYFNTYGYNFVAENILDTHQTMVGDVTGTSFAAPIVAGVASLLHEWAIRASTDRDSRVIKAVLMNTADRDLRDPLRPRLPTPEPSAWVQPTIVRPELTLGLPKVTFLRPGSKEFGAGVVDAYAALRNYMAGEVHEPDDPDPTHTLFINAFAREEWWDFQGLASGRSVEYFLGPLSGLFRSTLVWLTEPDGFAPWLAMELWRDDPLSAPAVGPADQIYARHARHIETPVQLFHLHIDNELFNHPTLGPIHHEFILRIVNLSNETVYFGLSVWGNFIPAPPTRPASIPEPLHLSLLATAALLLRRPPQPRRASLVPATRFTPPHSLRNAT